MSVKYTIKKDKLKDIMAKMKGLKNRKVTVGAGIGEGKSEHAWLAGIHEYGLDIKPKDKKYLTVPLNPDAAKKKASDFKDLFFFKSKKGNLLLVKRDGKDIVPYYWLTKSVKIPERSFQRAGYDKNIKKIATQTKRAMSSVVAGTMDVDKMLDSLGQQLATAIKKYATDLKIPENSPITIENKGSSNPLVGKTKNGMIESIGWEIK